MYPFGNKNSSSVNIPCSFRLIRLKSQICRTYLEIDIGKADQLLTKRDEAAGISSRLTAPLCIHYQRRYIEKKKKTREISSVNGCLLPHSQGLTMSFPNVQGWQLSSLAVWGRTRTQGKSGISTIYHSLVHRYHVILTSSRHRTGSYMGEDERGSNLLCQPDQVCVAPSLTSKRNRHGTSPSELYAT